MNIQTEQTKLFNKYGVFFAFSNDQLTEGIDKLKKEGALLEGEKITRSNIIGGMFYPTKHKDTFIKEFTDLHNNHAKHKKDKFNALNKAGKDKEIIKALYNYECFYTGDYKEAYNNDLKNLGITLEDVKRVYLKELPNTD